MKLSASEIEEFSEKVWKYYSQNGRHDLPWRQPERGDEFDPYKILVSEIMLQQTQVQRVLVKYPRFLELFPDIQTLAAAELGEVLKAWQGLGYNRRAKYLWLASKEIIKRLEKEGFVRKGLRSGSHQKWTHSDGRIVIVPHPKKDFKIGTLKSIFKQAGWE